MRIKDNRPVLLLFIGSTLSGKTRTEYECIATGRFDKVCSYTTREMRDGEEDGGTHNFKTMEDFEAVPKDDILAQALIYGNMYWTQKSDYVGKTKPIIYVIDPLEAQRLKDTCKEFRCIILHFYCPLHEKLYRMLEDFSREIEPTVVRLVSELSGEEAHRFNIENMNRIADISIDTSNYTEAQIAKTIISSLHMVGVDV